MNAPLAQPTDDELVHLCQARGGKDDRPFTELFRRHRVMVWSLCYRFTNDPQDAEDLVQEVFFKAYRGLARFEGRSSFRTWLARIAVNTGKNELRRRAHRAPVSPSSIDNLVESLPASGSPEWGLLEREGRARLVEALDSLRPADREAILLKDLEQQPYKEVAQVLGVGLSAAKMRVLRARLALQKVYRQLETGERIR